MLLTTVSLVPVAVALALALGLFMAWTTYLIRADRRLLATRTAEASAAAAPVPVTLVPAVRAALPAPVVAIVAPVTTERARERRHYLVAAPDLAPDPTPEPVPSPVVVRSGSFCTVLGLSGVTANGTEMVCSSENGARPRWRRAVRELQRTA